MYLGLDPVLEAVLLLPAACAVARRSGLVAMTVRAAGGAPVHTLLLQQTCVGHGGQ